MPQVSVIIPTYNRAHCVGEAIDSVLAQTFTDYEIIVVDDGSTDNTSAVLKAYGNKIRAIRQNNQGVSVARNTGILASTAPWIAFLDSDDLWLPEKLQIQFHDVTNCSVDVIGHFVDARFDVCENQPTTLFQLRHLLGTFTSNPVRKRPLLDTLNTQFFTPTWFLRRNVILDAGLFNPYTRIYEDLELLTKCALRGSFLVNCSCQVTVRRVPLDTSPLSSLHISNKPESMSNLCRIYESLLHSDNLLENEAFMLRKALSGARADLSMAYSLSGDSASARKYALLSFRDNPNLKSILRSLLLLIHPSYGAHFIAFFNRCLKRHGIRRSEQAL